MYIKVCWGNNNYNIAECYPGAAPIYIMFLLEYAYYDKKYISFINNFNYPICIFIEILF